MSCIDLHQLLILPLEYNLLLSLRSNTQTLPVFHAVIRAAVFAVWGLIQLHSTGKLPFSAGTQLDGYKLVTNKFRLEIKTIPSEIVF